MKVTAAVKRSVLAGNIKRVCVGAFGGEVMYALEIADFKTVQPTQEMCYQAYYRWANEHMAKQ